MVPSVKTIQEGLKVDRTKALTIRKLLWACDRPQDVGPALEAISDVIGGFGVEYIPQGLNQKSPAITYVNMGDTYTWTVLYINGGFRIGAWGDIVERGNYR